MKVYFPAQPVYTPLVDDNKVVNRVVLDEDFLFQVDDKDYWLPKGYWSDGASIPRLVWSIIGSPFEPDLIGPAFAHDGLYSVHVLTRAQADNVLFYGLKQNGVNTIRSHVIWGAVRSCAWCAWGNSTGDIIEIKKVRQEISKRDDRAKFLFWVAP
jgi:hypothetical protein